MKITKRQYDILKYLIDHREEFVSSAEMARQFHVTSRTIKNEMPFLRSYVKQFQSFELQSIQGKGTKAAVTDKNFFISEMISFSKNELTIGDQDESEMVRSLLQYLVNRTTYTSKQTILSQFFISESTFYKLYQQLKPILESFHLELKYTKQLGYTIAGNEIDKRNLIVKYKLMNDVINPLMHSQDISHVYNFVADAFIKFQYKVTDQILQNISSHVVLSDQRVKQGMVVEQAGTKSLQKKVEYLIAKEICSHFLMPYAISGEQLERETLLLTQNILGKITYALDEQLQTEINHFIDDAFHKIHDKFHVNFELVEKLKLFLVLHLVPLFYRVRSKTQLTNLMTLEIQQQFPFANDISLYFSLLVEEHFGLTISQNELSYITLYFNYGLEELDLSSSSKRILILTALRNSETVLLRHKLLSWFPKQIMEIKFAEPTDSGFDLEQFDAIFTTEKETEQYKGAVTMINMFPVEADYKKINLALNGYTDTDSILEKFNERCFFSGEVRNKQEILRILCENAMQTYDLDDSFFETINSREQIASTYFGNGVALPHPLVPITKETFVSVGILKKPIAWDDNHMIQFVMLISIENHNPRAFQFWYYMSEMVRNTEYLRNIAKQEDFEGFLDIVKTSLQGSFL